MAQPSVHQLYKRLETVGKGAYGSVSKGIHIPTGNVVALKIINLDTPDDDVDDIQREVALLAQLRDAPNITKYFGCYMDGPRVWIVMEFAQGGSVLALMKASRDGCLEEKFISVIIREVLVGLSYLHKVPVIHRDMKAANVLVTSTGKVMICDFGVSALLATTSSKRNTLTGTPYWMAPEVVQAVPVYDTKADIWSLGIMIYEMVKGTPPHSNLDKFKVMDLIPRAKPPRLTDAEAGKDMRDFMSFCLKESPTERLPADELLKTKWIKSVAKVPLSVLQEPVRRLQQAGPRDSLAGPLDWEVEECVLDTDIENIWEFETVRGRPHATTFEDDASSYYDGLDTEPANAQATIRPGQSAALPSSLRLLFGDDSTQQNTFHIAIPPISDKIPDLPTHTIPVNSNSPSGLSSSSPDISTASTTRPLIPRKRSQSTGEGLTGQSTPHPDPYHPNPSPSPNFNLASSTAFQFPANPKAITTPLGSTHARDGLASSSTSTSARPNPATTSPGSHQTTYSLDTSSSNRRNASASAARPSPSIMRTRSATALPEVQSPPSSAVAAMPSLHHPDFDSSSNSRTTNLGTPGLKDVLKIPSLSSEHQLGLTDLLPPSPSVNSRIFSSSQSHLNTSTTTNPSPAPFVHPNFKDAGSSFSLVGSITSLSGQSVVPILRPLDYSTLVSVESTQAELARTIDDLAKCLSIVETGLTSMLDTVYANAIEEEQEESVEGNITDAEIEQEQDSYFSLYNKPISFNE
ncbi:STE/STE20/YSK protein kinase [Lentinula raphanica]|nr:STE/STE20/YSK protein kinase [Lentinula raphanica]